MRLRSHAGPIIVCRSASVGRSRRYTHVHISIGHGCRLILLLGEETPRFETYRRDPDRPNSDVNHQSQYKHLHARQFYEINYLDLENIRVILI